MQNLNLHIYFAKCGKIWNYSLAFLKSNEIMKTNLVEFSRARKALAKLTRKVLPYNSELSWKNQTR